MTLVHNIPENVEGLWMLKFKPFFPIQGVYVEWLGLNFYLCKLFLRDPVQIWNFPQTVLQIVGFSISNRYVVFRFCPRCSVYLIFVLKKKFDMKMESFEPKWIYGKSR